MKKSWLVICLLNFCIAALMGILLRLAYLFPMDFNYTYLLHAHSHTVILGWCYLAVYSFVIGSFIPEEKQQKPIYNLLFWITEIAVIGMMFTFPFQGYGLFSITFSTLHIFCSYYFCCLIFKENHADFADQKLLRSALFFLVFSTIGVWCLGPVAASGTKDSAFYNTAIQFYLHFQFNGWFIFVVLALLFRKMRQSGILFPKNSFNRFHYLLLGSVFLTFGLPAGWYFPNEVLKWMNAFGLLLQILAVIEFGRMLFPNLYKIKSTIVPIAKLLYALAFSCLILKVLIQSMSVFPEIAQFAHAIRNFTIGFIHLMMLGAVTSLLLAFITEASYFNSHNKLSKTGILLFIIGFLTMEFLLFGQGYLTYLEFGTHQIFFISILISSILITIGLFALLTNLLQSKK